MATYIHTVKTNATRLVILYENLLTWQAFGREGMFAKLHMHIPYASIRNYILIKTITNQVSCSN